MCDNFFDLEDDITEEYLTALYSTIYEQIEKENEGLAVVNPTRIIEFARAVRFFEKYAKKHSIHMSYAMHTPLKNIGYISLTGKNVIFDPTIIKYISEIASVVDVYPRNNGCVQIDLVFNDITVNQ